MLSPERLPEARKTLLEVARGGPNPELQRKAIEYLGVSGDRAALRELYRSAGPALKEKVFQAMLVAGDAEGLAAAARAETDPRLRRKAIHSLASPAARGAASRSRRSMPPSPTARRAAP